MFKKLIQKLIVKLAIRKAGKMLNKLRELLIGKKTYLAAVGIIVAAVVQWLADNNTQNLINKVLEAVALVTVRAGIKNG